MRARVGAGIAGWLAGLLPLVAVNGAAYAGLLAYQSTAAFGALALFGGILLGGGLAGGVGGRHGRGLGGAAVAGGLAALLYAATVIGLMFGTGYFTYAPPLIAQHPIRVSAAVVFCALLLLGVAAAAGALSGRAPAPPSAPRVAQSRPSQVRSGTYSGPRVYPQRSPSISAPRGAYPSGPRQQGDSGRREGDTVHAGGRHGADRGEAHERDPRHFGQSR